MKSRPELTRVGSFPHLYSGFEMRERISENIVRSDSAANSIASRKRRAAGAFFLDTSSRGSAMVAQFPVIVHFPQMSVFRPIFPLDLENDPAVGLDCRRRQRLFTLGAARHEISDDKRQPGDQ